MKIETEFEIRKEKRATTRDLFQVCRRHYSQPVASVAAESLFWSQCGQYKLRAREGFYKEDADLVQVLGKHASSIRRALKRICAKVGEDRPDALFEMDHGPKPGQRSGQVRWLFRMPRGDEMIREALLLAQTRQEKRQNAPTNRRTKPRSIMQDCSHRSAQNERTLYVQKDSSERPSESLSSTKKQREKTNPETLKEKSGKDLNEKDSEELTRFKTLWNTICSECKEPTLAWLPSDVDCRAGKLVEVIRHLGIPEMPDEEVSKRLRLLCGPQSRPVFEGMGDAFSKFNPHGLAIKTFANFGPKVWRAVQEALDDEERRRKQWDYLKSL
jgi:hypothetical protein